MEERTARRKGPPLDYTFADTIAILGVLREHLPEVSEVRRNVIAGHLRDALYRLHSSVPRGRPASPYPPKLLRERYRVLVRPPDGELFKRHKASGIWPDTKSKWAADTDTYLRAWWQRRGKDELLDEGNPVIKNLPYPEKEIAARLGPKPPDETEILCGRKKSLGSLREVAYFLLMKRYAISRRFLDDVVRKRP